MERSQQQKMIIVLAAVLIAALLASGIVVYVISTSSTEEVDPLFADQPTDSASDATPAPTSDQTGFDTAPLKRNDYTSLNAQLIQAGQLPVQPPAGTGKANPFL